MCHIILNPTSGRGAALKALKIVEARLKDAKIEYQVHKTEYAGHATDIVKELSATPDTVILTMGGDGSFYEALNGIQNFDNVTLGLVPCGSGNDFVKVSGHSMDVEKSMDIIVNGKVGYLDFIQLDDRRCLNVVGGGMDADVLVNYANMKRFHGKTAYYLAFLKTVLKPKFHKLRITIDGTTMDKSVFMIGVGNGKFIGGGLPICPNGVPDDGLMDIVVVNEVKNKAKIILEIPGFLKAKHIYKPYTEEFTAKEVKIEILDDSKFEADGEIFGNSEINAKIVSNTLKVFR